MARRTRTACSLPTYLEAETGVTGSLSLRDQPLASLSASMALAPTLARSKANALVSVCRTGGLHLGTTLAPKSLCTCFDRLQDAMHLALQGDTGSALGILVNETTRTYNLYPASWYADEPEVMVLFAQMNQTRNNLANGADITGQSYDYVDTIGWKRYDVMLSNFSVQLSAVSKILVVMRANRTVVAQLQAEVQQSLATASDQEQLLALDISELVGELNHAANKERMLFSKMLGLQRDAVNAMQT